MARSFARASPASAADRIWSHAHDRQPIGAAIRLDSIRRPSLLRQPLKHRDRTIRAREGGDLHDPGLVCRRRRSHHHDLSSGSGASRPSPTVEQMRPGIAALNSSGRAGTGGNSALMDPRPAVETATPPASSMTAIPSAGTRKRSERASPPGRCERCDDLSLSASQFLDDASAAPSSAVTRPAGPAVRPGPRLTMRSSRRSSSSTKSPPVVVAAGGRSAEQSASAPRARLLPWRSQFQFPQRSTHVYLARSAAFDRGNRGTARDRRSDSRASVYRPMSRTRGRARPTRTRLDRGLPPATASRCDT